MISEDWISPAPEPRAKSEIACWESFSTRAISTWVLPSSSEAVIRRWRADSLRMA